MHSIRYLISESHLRVVADRKTGKFPVELGKAYIVVGVPDTHRVCKRCNKEFELSRNDRPKKRQKPTCRYHDGNWAKIKVTIKEEHVDPETEKVTKKKN